MIINRLNSCLKRCESINNLKVTKEIETDANFVGKAQEIRRQKLNTHMTSNRSQTLNSQKSVITSVDQQEQLCVVCMSSPR